jgi:hypothetical protein
VNRTVRLRLDPSAGFEEPTAGDITLNGTPSRHLKPYERNVSTVFQNFSRPARNACEVGRASARLSHTL